MSDDGGPTKGWRTEMGVGVNTKLLCPAERPLLLRAPVPSGSRDGRRATQGAGGCEGAPVSGDGIPVQCAGMPALHHVAELEVWVARTLGPRQEYTRDVAAVVERKAGAS